MAQTDLLTSVCLCTYVSSPKRLEDLHKVYQSLEGYLREPCEVVIVDDRSPLQEETTKLTEGFIESMKKSHPNIDVRRHVNDTNLRHSKSQNLAWELSKGDVLIHIEDDVTADYPGWNQVFAKCLQDHPEVGQVLPRGSGRGEHIPYDWYFEYMWGLGGLFAIKREVFEKIGGWDESLCLTGDTVIPLLNGTKKTLKELSDLSEWKGLFTYSLDKNLKIVAGDIKKVWKSGTKPVLRVTLDNGESFRCTDDHKIMLRDGSYTEAKNLVPGTSLMPLYQKYRQLIVSNGNNDNLYEKVYVPKYNRFLYTHVVIGNIKGSSMRGKVIHHKDFNSLNDSPDNLVKLTRAQHAEAHAVDLVERERRYAVGRQTLADNKEWQKNVRVGMAKVHKLYGDKARAASLIAYPMEQRIANLKAVVKDPVRNLERAAKSKATQLAFSEERKHDLAIARSKLSEDMWANRSTQQKKDVAVAISEGLQEFWRSPEANDVRQHLSVLARMPERIERSRKTSSKMWRDLTPEERAARCFKLSEKTKAQWAARNDKDRQELGKKVSSTLKQYNEKKRNHSVVSVERLDGIEDVYDMEIAEHHNFAIGCSDSSGVFVHNCHQIEPDYNFRVRMAGWRVVQINDFAMGHLGEGDFMETFDRRVQMTIGVYNMLMKWNRRFMGFWDYRSVFSNSSDDFPINVAFRRMLAARIAAQAKEMQDYLVNPQYPMKETSKNNIQKAIDHLMKAKEEAPVPFKFPTIAEDGTLTEHWGGFEKVQLIRPTGRQREAELINKMGSNFWFKEEPELHIQVFNLAKHMNVTDYKGFDMTDLESIKKFLEGQAFDYVWECKAVPYNLDTPSIHDPK